MAGGLAAVYFPKSAGCYGEEAQKRDKRTFPRLKCFKVIF